MAPLPSYRFPTAEKQFPFANSGVYLFGPFYVEDSKAVVEKHYGLILTCMVTRAVHLETCSDLKTDKLLNAYRKFSSRRCQHQPLYSYSGKTFVGASEELKKTVKALNNDRIYKAFVVASTTWKFNPPYVPEPPMWRCLREFDPERQRNALSHSSIQKTLF